MPGTTASREDQPGGASYSSANGTAPAGPAVESQKHPTAPNSPILTVRDVSWRPARNKAAHALRGNGSPRADFAPFRGLTKDICDVYLYGESPRCAAHESCSKRLNGAARPSTKSA